MTQSSTAEFTNTKARMLTAGAVEGDTYVLTFDDGLVAITKDEAIATSAASAKRQGVALQLELETRTDGQPPLIIELKPAPKQEVVRHESAAAKPVTQALAKTPAIPVGLIVDPQELTAQLDALRQHFNVISPMIGVSQFAPGYGVNLVVVRIDPTITDEKNGRGVDTYKGKIHGANERALNKSGLLKISQALGIQWAAPKRLDDGSQANYWHWQHYGWIRTYDGQMLPVTGSRELDLRNGSAEAAAMSAGQLPVARTFGNEICETKAMERAIRNFVAQSYTVEQLQKPFLIPRFSFTPDMADPEIKKLVTQQAMSGMGALYPPSAPAMPTDAHPALPAPATTTAATPAAARLNPFAEPAAATAKAGEPQRPIGGLKVAEVKSHTGVGRNDKPYTKTTVVFDTGESGVTFSGSITETANKAKKAGQWVKATLEDNEQYPDQQNLKALEILDGTQPDLPIAEAKL